MLLETLVEAAQRFADDSVSGAVGPFPLFCPEVLLEYNTFPVAAEDKGRQRIGPLGSNNICSGWVAVRRGDTS
jgi:hypothetical protein